MTRHLELDETQQQSIRNIIDMNRDSMESLREDARANREAIAALQVTDPDYGAKLQDLSLKIGQLATDATLLAGQLRQQIAAELTPEQQQKLAEGRQHMKERFEGRRDRRHRRHEADTEQ